MTQRLVSLSRGVSVQTFRAKGLGVELQAVWIAQALAPKSNDLQLQWSILSCIVYIGWRYALELMAPVSL